MSEVKAEIIELPRPFVTGGLSLAEAINLRRSVRSFSPDPIQLFQLSQVLWAAQGITNKLKATRTIPSAGGTYPLELFAVIGEEGIEKTPSGVYHYDPETQNLTLTLPGDIRAEMAAAALGQDFIAVAPVSLVICAIYKRTLMRYNIRAERYIFMEAGHSAQNVYLQATALNLGTVAVGAFKDDTIHSLLHLESSCKPLYILPLGKAIYHP
jgi:SagB-type dehydrogenase family enzyme